MSDVLTSFIDSYLSKTNYAHFALEALLLEAFFLKIQSNDIRLFIKSYYLFHQ